MPYLNISEASVSSDRTIFGCRCCSSQLPQRAQTAADPLAGKAGSRQTQIDEADDDEADKETTRQVSPGPGSVASVNSIIGFSSVATSGLSFQQVPNIRVELPDIDIDFPRSCESPILMRHQDRHDFQ